MQPELIVQIPPLVPGQRELQAQARRGDMLAVINIRSYGYDNLYILEQYWDRANRKIRRKLTPGQDERGLALVQLLRERLSAALEAAGWQQAGVNFEGRPLWRYVEPTTREQHPLPLPTEVPIQKPASSTTITQPPRNTHAPIPSTRTVESTAPTLTPTPSQPAQAQPARKRVEVPAAAQPRAAYQRTIHTRPVIFTCRECGATVSQQRFPGPQPRYCSETCKQKAMRAGALARVRRFRERKQAH